MRSACARGLSVLLPDRLGGRRADLPVCVVVSVAVGLPGPGAAASPAGCTVLTAYRFVRSDWNLVCKTTLFKTWSRAEYVCRSPYVGCAS